MKTIMFRRIVCGAAAPILLAACTSSPEKFTGADPVRARLSQLESNVSLAYQAPLAMKEARNAVLAAEQRQKDPRVSQHLVYVAERKVDIAEVESQQHFLEEQRIELSDKRDALQLQARTQESRVAQSAANQAERTALEAQRQAQSAQTDALRAQKQMDQAKQESVNARRQTALAEQESEDAKQKLTQMQQQLDEMDARQEARGTVVTLGDVLFDFAKADINPAAMSHLAKLASFLNSNSDRHVMIEGHTDNAGADDVNLRLSQRRANAVKDYLQSQGVAGTRLQTVGKGAEFPVTDNDSVAKRQQNRRVEVIIADPLS